MKRPNKETKVCSHCNKLITRNKSDFNPNSRDFYCSKQCRIQGWCKPTILVECLYCKKQFHKKPKQIRSEKHFCNLTCFAKHTNNIGKFQPKISKRSKLEKWLESNLVSQYPNIHFQFNKRKHIGHELDIFIPELKVAIEINGVYHYRPIYGEDKLNKIQKTDQQKVQVCESMGIDLLVINTTSQKTFSEKTSIPFLNLIKEKIEEKIGRGGRI